MESIFIMLKQAPCECFMYSYKSPWWGEREGKGGTNRNTIYCAFVRNEILESSRDHGCFLLENRTMSILPVSHACGAHPRYQPGEGAGRMLWRYKGMRVAGGKLSPGLFLLLHFICKRIPDGITPGIKQNRSRKLWSHLSWSGVIFSLPNQNPSQSFSLPRTLQPRPWLPHPTTKDLPSLCGNTIILSPRADWTQTLSFSRGRQSRKQDLGEGGKNRKLEIHLRLMTLTCTTCFVLLCFPLRSSFISQMEFD